MDITLEQLRNICGFYYKVTYMDGMPNHFCCMSYESRSVYQSYKLEKSTVSGYCMYLECCPIKQVLNKIKL